MPNYTPNYNLAKPIEATENYDVDVFNANADKIDTAIAGHESRIATIENKTQLRVQKGTVSVTVPSGQTGITMDVPFPEAFGEIPEISFESFTQWYITYRPSAGTNTAGRLGVRHIDNTTSGGSFTVSWIAVGKW